MKTSNDQPGIYEVYVYSDPNMGLGKAGTIEYRWAKNIDEAREATKYKGMAYGIERVDDDQAEAILKSLKKSMIYYEALYDELNDIVNPSK